MAITEVELPFQGKITFPISKTINFKTTVSKARNNYVQIAPSGIANTQDTIKIRYAMLTDAEFASLEATLQEQTTDTVLVYTPPSELNPRRFRYPTSWKTKRVRQVHPTAEWLNSVELDLVSFGQVLSTYLAAKAYYTISVSPLTVDKGDFVTFTINTVNILDNTVLNYTLSSATITGDDFVDNSMSGVVTIVSNIGTITKQIKADASVVTGNSFYLDLFNGVLNVGSSDVVTVQLAGQADWVAKGLPVFLVEGVTPEASLPDDYTNYLVASCSSEDGSKILALYGLNTIKISTNNGTIYTTSTVNSDNIQWLGCCCSDDFQYLYLIGLNHTTGIYSIYVSTNSGSSFSLGYSYSVSPYGVNDKLVSIACSSNGQYVYAGKDYLGDTITKSSNYGSSWSVITPVGYDYATRSLSVSPDGTTILAVIANALLLSTNSGSSFTPQTVTGVGSPYWYYADMSDDATIRYISDGYVIRRTTNSGSSWSIVLGDTSPFYGSWFDNIACSADGQVVLLIGGDVCLLSTDAGDTWVDQIDFALDLRNAGYRGVVNRAGTALVAIGTGNTGETTEPNLFTLAL